MLRRPARLLALLLAVLGGAGLAAAGCRKAAATIQYSGQELPPLVKAGDIRLFAGRTPPDEHTIVGVVTSRCETVNDSPGVLAGRCSHPSMQQAARAHAAKVGGTGLLGLECATRQVGREVTRRDAGQSQVDVRRLVECRGTVVRGPVANAAPAGSGDAGTAGDFQSDRTLTIAGIEVAVGVARRSDPIAAASRPARLPEEVGELNAVPPNAVVLARLHARCQRGCARSVAHRALRKLAAELGALAIAEQACTLEGDRWRCHALAVDERDVAPPPAPPPPAAVPPAPGAGGAAAAGGGSGGS